MSIDPVDPREASASALLLLDHVAAAERAGHRRLRAAADHFHVPDDARIDDRTAAALDSTMRATVAGVDAGIRDHAARLLTSRGEAALAQGLRTAGSPFDRVVRAGLFRDAALFGELYARVRMDALARALPVTVAAGGDGPTMVARLAQASDRLIAGAAVGMLAAQARRASVVDGVPAAVDLIRSHHARIAWWVAAALREMAGAGDRIAELDAALAESVRRAIDAQGELVPLEIAAMRLALAVEPQGDEVPALLGEAIGDGRLVFFTAIVARASGLAFERVRDLVIDPDSARLWVVLRALAVDRATIARIGFALAEAEPVRDVEAFADRIDSIMAVTPGAARVALAPMALDAEYHAAMLALGAAA
ncbi:DUF2336 domain-containing protein [Sphingomonas sp. 2R-10]|uniref:DUF2336 domain-containing protein n=1 Tax=Sphingomonas sp. 2R-10 TaxID=3045148 RepID=UPI000F7B3357|nr:DUF2336 domain-containing protein [Sphingomonas sp. 2R-10]MDJ0276174.1 DUF2336 domain-containing protein [Sphingomonas sp. 2R-10]